MSEDKKDNVIQFPGPKDKETEIVFEPEDKPQFLPGPSIQKARKIMKDYSPDDYILWPGGGDPIAAMVTCMVASEICPVVKILRWERNIEEGDRDRRKGYYMPVALEMRKEIKNDRHRSA